ncbi:MAG: rod shape-determining protein RodA [Candidatus Nanopelagicales bacterium]
MKSAGPRTGKGDGANVRIDGPTHEDSVSARAAEQTIIDLRSTSDDPKLAPPNQPNAVVVTRRPAPSGRVSKLTDRMRTNATDFRRYDLVLIGCALALSLIGAVLVWSATRGRLLASDSDPNNFLTRHLLNLVIGVVLGWLVTKVDYRTLRAYTPVVYGVVITLLLVVLSPLGVTINGAKAWITLPAGFTLQPGEFAKIVVILAMAMILAERDVGMDRPSDTDVRASLVWAAGPVALIMLQPDLGTVLVIGTIIIAIVAVSNARARWVVGLLGGAVAAGALAIALGVLDQYQLDRLLAFTDPERDLQGIGYNTAQARIAIGGGGLFGQGLFNGNQTQGAFVPYQQTDFVFSVAGEEFGLLGATIIIGLVGVILWRGIQIARLARDPFGRLVATGVVAWFAFQAFENIGMNLGIMPVTGVPLPFVSYGGTSMFAAWIGIGLLQSVHLRSR